MSQCIIDACDRPITADTALVCRTCSDRLAKDLRWIADNAHDLDTVVTRQARTGNNVGRASAETRLPLDWSAVIDGDAIRNTLSTWARDAIETRGIPYPADTIPAVATFLADEIEWFRHRPYAGEVWDELAYAATVLRRALDTSAGRVYRGPCLTDTDDGECREDLYARPEASYATCRSCGAQHDSAHRREWLLDQVTDQLVPAVMIETALRAWLDDAPTFAAIRKWIERRLLVSRGYRLDGTPTYRIGDAIEVANRMRKRKAPREMALSVRLGTLSPTGCWPAVTRIDEVSMFTYP